MTIFCWQTSSSFAKQIKHSPKNMVMLHACWFWLNHSSPSREMCHKRALWFDFDLFSIENENIVFCHVWPEPTRNSIHIGKKKQLSPKATVWNCSNPSTKRSATSSKSPPRYSQAFSCPKIKDSTNGVTLLRSDQIEWKNVAPNPTDSIWTHGWTSIRRTHVATWCVFKCLCSKWRIHQDRTFRRIVFGIRKFWGIPKCTLTQTPWVVQQLTFHAPHELPNVNSDW